MSHAVDQSYAFYSEPRRVAAKEHTCGACGLPIFKGNLYADVTWKDTDRGIGRVKRCARCQMMHEHLRELAPGERWPDEDLNCGENYQDEWGHDPPEWVQSLAFWVPGEPLPAIHKCQWIEPRGWFDSQQLGFCFRGHWGYGFLPGACLPPRRRDVLDVGRDPTHRARCTESGSACEGEP